MPILTPAQRDALRRRYVTLSNEQLIEYVRSGDISLDAMPLLVAERRQLIEDAINQPDPLEAADWNEIAGFDKNDVSKHNILRIKIDNYIAKYSQSCPYGNHLAAAQALKNELSVVQEQVEYDKVDLFNYQSMLLYLVKHPNTSHFQELDDAMWSLVQGNLQMIQKFITDLPATSHAMEAKTVLKEFTEWGPVKSSKDIFKVNDYITTYPKSSLLQEAKIEMLTLKAKEIEQMKANVSSYDVGRFYRLMEEEIFTANELMAEGLITENALKGLSFSPEDLPEIEQVPDPNITCPPDHTDVYFFGIPSTGKTCILMGLFSSPKIMIQNKVCSGAYASDLMEYIFAGRTPGSTYGTYVAVVNASIPDNDVKHPVNLIEMSGEEFAINIAGNKSVSFETMGTGATKLLKNNNRKSFFVIVDPTTDAVKVKRRIVTSDNDGNERVSYQPYRVSQRQTIKALIDLFRLPQNAEIMKKVDAIHFIVTKADMLDYDGDREEKAMKRFLTYHTDVIEPMKELCELYTINITTKYKPCLFTFSLGKFYIGDIYEYNRDDADKLIDLIKDVTRGKRKLTFSDKLRGWLNS